VEFVELGDGGFESELPLNPTNPAGGDGPYVAYATKPNQRLVLSDEGFYPQYPQKNDDGADKNGPEGDTGQVT
jgi:hypothetical protein